MSPIAKKRKIESGTQAANAVENGHTSDGSTSEEAAAAAEKPHVPHRRTSSSNANQRGPSMITGGVGINSSLFQLQVDELLAKVRPDYERRMKKAEDALHKLKTLIEHIPAREPRSITEALDEQKKHHGIRIPFPKPEPSKDAKYKLAYSRPTNINVVGSYGRRTAIQIGDSLAIDLAVTVPSDLFQEKDYLNYRYFHKRAYYLSCIATTIEESQGCNFSISYALQDDHDLQPVIIVKPGSGVDDFTSSRCQIRVVLAAEENLFPISKTLPTKNSVRPNVGDGPSNVKQNPPTPYYNAILRSECSSLVYLKLLHAAHAQSDAFANACILGSVWLRQRKIPSGGFGSFEWACSMASLLQAGGPKGRPVFSKGYNSYQLFKALLQFLAVRDLVADPLYIRCDGGDIVQDGHPIIYDGLTGLNILFKVTRWSYEMLRHEARRTLRLLSDPLADQFEACFITRVDDPLQKFDRIVTLPLGESQKAGNEQLDAMSDGDLYCQKVHEVLMKGLGDRVILIDIHKTRQTPWDLKTPRPPKGRHEQIHVGLLLNPDHISRTIDRGPSAEDKVAAAAFQKFWGEEAELRRFKDGSIQETLTWTSSDPSSTVLNQIITFILRRHIGAEVAKNVRIVGENLDQLIPSQGTASLDSGAVYQPIMNAYDILEKSIRNLDGLPLQIRQVSAADASLRFASVRAPLLNISDDQKEPTNVQVQFEGSSRWPDDLIAIQRTKIAFLLKIGELLEDSTADLTARLGLENTEEPILNTAFLDILYPSGAFFRLRIHHERERNLLEQTLKSSSSSTTSSREEIASALSTYKRDFIQAPLHTQAVRTLSTRFPLLSPSMRLVKIWRDSHLLSYHIRDELIELLTIRAFVHPYPWSVPGSVMTGFLRTLTFISKWDWRSDPLIMDLNGEMTNQDIEAIKLRFEAWRKIDPAMNRVSMFVASNVDQEGTTWTQGNPSKIVAARFTGLAKAACKVVHEQGLDIQPRALFVPEMDDYDFVIYINPKFTTDKQDKGEKAEAVFKNLQIQKSEDEEMMGFKPVQMFVEELRKLYKNNVLFFHNADRGSIIGGLWNRQTGPRAWKVNLPYPSMPVASSDGDAGAQVDINKGAVLHEIARLGGDMVLRVESKH